MDEARLLDAKEELADDQKIANEKFAGKSRLLLSISNAPAKQCRAM
jgi:hypothetical protein